MIIALWCFVYTFRVMGQLTALCTRLAVFIDKLQHTFFKKRGRTINPTRAFGNSFEIKKVGRVH